MSTHLLYGHLLAILHSISLPVPSYLPQPLPICSLSLHCPMVPLSSPRSPARNRPWRSNWHRACRTRKPRWMFCKKLSTRRTLFRRSRPNCWLSRKPSRGGCSWGQSLTPGDLFLLPTWAMREDHPAGVRGRCTEVAGPWGACPGGFDGSRQELVPSAISALWAGKHPETLEAAAFFPSTGLCSFWSLLSRWPNLPLG